MQYPNHTGTMEHVGTAQVLQMSMNGDKPRSYLDRSSSAAPRPGWQTLAELNLLVGTGFESEVQGWMFETMRRLGIPTYLLERVLTSALEAILRIENSKSVVMNIPVFELHVYTPSEVPAGSGSKRNWGFFCIEKHGVTTARGDHVDHLLEFFLYLDG